MRKLLLKFMAIMTSLFVAAQPNAPKFTTQNNSDFAKTIADKGVQLVDVRTAAEFESGRIPGALNIDVYSDTFDAEALKLDKSRPVAVYCRSGTRSQSAANRLVSLGFKVYNLDRGISGWNGKVVRN